MKSADLFVTGVNGWLRAEAASSSRPDDINNYLNDHAAVVAGVALPIDDSANISAQKTLAHTNRFQRHNAFWEAFATHPDNDYASARLLFAAMMRLSGARRKQAYITAPDSEAYPVLRRRSATLPLSTLRGVFLVTLQQTYADTKTENLSATPALGIEHLRELADDTIDYEMSSLEVIQQAASKGLDKGANRDMALQAVTDTEQSLVSYTAHMVIFAAGLRSGTIGNVPLLEPRSISADPEPGIIYPFQEDFWNKYESL